MASLLQTPVQALIRILISSAPHCFPAPRQSRWALRLELRVYYTTGVVTIDCFSSVLSCLVSTVGDCFGSARTQAAVAVERGVKSFAVMKFSI